MPAHACASAVCPVNPTGCLYEPTSMCLVRVAAYPAMQPGGPTPQNEILTPRSCNRQKTLVMAVLSSSEIRTLKRFSGRFSGADSGRLTPFHCHHNIWGRGPGISRISAAKSTRVSRIAVEKYRLRIANPNRNPSMFRATFAATLESHDPKCPKLEKYRLKFTVSLETFNIDRP